MPLATIFLWMSICSYWAIRMNQNLYIRATRKTPRNHFCLSAICAYMLILLGFVAAGGVVVVVVVERDRSYIIKTPWVWHNAPSSMPIHQTHNWILRSIYIILFELVGHWCVFFYLSTSSLESALLSLCAVFFHLNISSHLQIIMNQQSSTHTGHRELHRHFHPNLHNYFLNIKAEFCVFLLFFFLIYWKWKYRCSSMGMANMRLAFLYDFMVCFRMGQIN